MKLRMIVIAMLAALLFSSVVLPANTVQAQSGVQIPIDYESALGAFEGAFTITRFAVQGGELVAIGTLTGTVTDAAGAVVGTVNQALTLPVSNISGTCDILHLELGPLDLDLLGLIVHLDQIVLDIDAQQGGGLLGDLLCSIANLLDNNSPLNPLSRLLNNILRILG